MPCETQEEADDRRETLAATGRLVPKTPRPLGCKAAKLLAAKKRDLATMFATHITEQKAASMEQMELYKSSIDRQAENQKGLSDAIGVLCNNMRRRNYPEDGVVARAAEELELAEMAMKKEEMELKRAEMALKREESRRRLLVLQNSQPEVETEIPVPAVAPPVAAPPVEALPAVAPPVPTARRSIAALSQTLRRR